MYKRLIFCALNLKAYVSHDHPVSVEAVEVRNRGVLVEFLIFSPARLIPLPSFPLLYHHCKLSVCSPGSAFALCSIASRPFWGYVQYFHKETTEPSKTLLPSLPNQFARSKTNIVFNQMQLGLQVKIFSQLKLIRPIMSLGES